MEWRAKQEVGGKTQKWPGWRAGWVDSILDSSFLRMSWPRVDIFYVCNITAKAVIDKPGYEFVPSTGATKPGIKNFPCDNYWVVDLGVNYKPDKNHKIYFKVNNLFDKFYANESAVYQGGAPGEYYAMPGRAFFVGMEYSF